MRTFGVYRHDAVRLKRTDETLEVGQRRMAGGVVVDDRHDVGGSLREEPLSARLGEVPGPQRPDEDAVLQVATPAVGRSAFAEPHPAGALVDPVDEPPRRHPRGRLHA